MTGKKMVVMKRDETVHQQEPRIWRMTLMFFMCVFCVLATQLNKSLALVVHIGSKLNTKTRYGPINLIMTYLEIVSVCQKI